MNIDTPEALAASVANLIPLEPPPSEAQIDEVLARFSVAFGVSLQLVEETRRLLHAKYRIRMEMGKTLTSVDEHLPWVASRSAEIDPFYWMRYRQMLIRNGWSPYVVSTLDRTTDELLNLLGNPEAANQWKRRGLVVGDVQSGKTATYAALICKAADAGYKMVVLLTGTLENVRRQTQERLDAAFVGLDSRDFLTAGQIGRKTQIGVGLLDGRRDGIVFTSRDSDFRKNTASALNISLGAVREPVLVVSKKNASVLNRLSGWLRAKNADHAGQIDVPMLLIDDEADNASINTRQKPGQTTAINHGIRDLLKLFTKSSYVGFTATPFANIFIDPESTSEMVGDDLFPENFIHVLEPPDNYVGMNALFAPTDPDANDESEADAEARMLIEVEDSEAWLPQDHKKDFEIDRLPDSLHIALRSFLLACAIRDLRAEGGDRRGGIHRSMLVNVSRFTDVQNRVAAAIHTELNEIRRSVRLHGALPPSAAASGSPEIARLQTLFNDYFPGVTHSWAEVLHALHTAISPIIVQPVNQSTGAAKLDYSIAKAPPGVRVIAVGGNSLSRGLTLEGLSTSYFLRNSKMYDTLLQMGRWFGYRDGYGDLCQVWLTAEAAGWYRHVTEATAELKRDFVRMKRRKATPKEFGLRVRCHPDTLLITARNKMASGMDILDAGQDVSLTGRGVETARLYADAKRNEANLDQMNTFIGQLVTRKGKPAPSPNKNALVWKDVDATDIAAFLDDFAIHPLNHALQGDSIADFLRDLPARQVPPLEKWTVAILTSGTASNTSLSALLDVEITTKKRKIKHSTRSNSLMVSGRSARVGSARDVRHGLSGDEAKAVEDRIREENPDKKGDVEADHFRAAMQAPLLLLYLLQGEEPGKKGYYRNGLILPAIGMHFPGAVDPDSPKRLVRYRLNMVAQDELFADLDDEPTQDEDDEN